jgi:NADH dehydrogenase FAD-containing subunit
MGRDDKTVRSPARRRLLIGLGAAAAVGVGAARAQGQAHTVVVGAGFAGATAAKYLRRMQPQMRITVVEPNEQFVACPLSNRVITGSLALRDISRSFVGFAERHGLRWVRGSAEDVDAARRELVVGKDRIAYDHLIVAPGVDFVYDGIAGMESAAAQAKIPHAWKAGPQTRQLREQLQTLRPGGVVAMHIPKVPYRCPPGPYERASLIATTLQARNPRAKLLVFDSNPEIQSKKDLFESIWRSRFAGMLEYVPNAEIEGVSPDAMTLDFKVQGKVKADLINLIPPQRAGAVAHRMGLVNVSSRWCGVNFLNYESTRHKGIYVLGDAIASAPGSPKSGHMANQQAKICAGAIAAASLGLPVPDSPIIANTCYSFISNTEAIHVAAVYRFDAEKKTMVPVQGAGGLSAAASLREALYAMAWATNILNDTLG